MKKAVILAATLLIAQKILALGDPNFVPAIPESNLEKSRSKQSTEDKKKQKQEAVPKREEHRFDEPEESAKRSEDQEKNHD